MLPSVAMANKFPKRMGNATGLRKIHTRYSAQEKCIWGHAVPY